MPKVTFRWNGKPFIPVEEEGSEFAALAHWRRRSALDRTQPGLPIKPGRCGMTHDYKRHGTTTLFAALDTLDGVVLGRCMRRHRHQEFIRSLKCRRARGPGR